MIQPKLSFLTALLLLLTLHTTAQTVSEKLATVFQIFERDSQLQNAVASLYVMDDSGRVVFRKNETVGLAPASTQKIITSATAYEVLGKAFTYKTAFGFVKNSNGTNSLYLKGSGDPTFGSWRWPQTKDSAVLGRIVHAAHGLKFNSTVFVDTSGWDFENTPGGWIWEDIGNYYGAGAGVFNWRENQYDIMLRSGATVGSQVVITGMEPTPVNLKFSSKVVAAEKGSGDNAYVYFSLSGDSAVLRGTIPINENHFVISGALPNPARQCAAAFLQGLPLKHEDVNSLKIVYANGNIQPRFFYTEPSPPLDSIIYWFNKKSINLYGEALLKTIAFQKSGSGSTEAGVDLVKNFWKDKGIPESALNMVDGSGLSPLNRVTTQAQVTVLQYAKKQPWFVGFYNALPEYNGMKLKSGTIRGVRGFAGYYTNRAGVSYTLSFLVNNYNGDIDALVKKMFAVLDVLK